MASITYKSLSSLQPIELKYQYFKDENLKVSKTSFQDGYTFYRVEGFENYQDAVINRDSCFVLTSAIKLNNVFEPAKTYVYGELPGTALIQPSTISLYYATHDTVKNEITLALSGTPFYFSPIKNTNEIEILINNQYLQIEETYPYKAYLSFQPLRSEEIKRQRFICIYQNKSITFKTLTKDGYRYLAFGSDNVMRAIGVMFNSSAVNNYVFGCVPLTLDSTSINFDPQNSWVTYYLQLNQEKRNKNYSINKEFVIDTNYLVDFPIEEAIRSGKATINIANLKTNVTPLGGPAPIDNSEPA
jgi:hypothetical protein